MTSDPPGSRAPDAALVDARGLRCPLPVIRLAKHAAHAEPGSLVRVLATDPAARHDIPAWCRLTGHELVTLAEDGDDTECVVRLRGG